MIRAVCVCAVLCTLVKLFENAPTRSELSVLFDSNPTITLIPWRSRARERALSLSVASLSAASTLLSRHTRRALPQDSSLRREALLTFIQVPQRGVHQRWTADYAPSCVCIRDDVSWVAVRNEWHPPEISALPTQRKGHPFRSSASEVSESKPSTLGTYDLMLEQHSKPVTIALAGTL